MKPAGWESAFPSPHCTPALTRDVLVRFEGTWRERLGLSLDGSSAERHDSIRGLPVTFDRHAW
jgi:hypothetical protein